jgi:arylsulfatase A-like enzyme
MDGVDLTPFVTGANTTETPHDYLFFRSGAAQAVRDERWKLMVSAPEGMPRKEWLFDLTADGEWTDLLAEHPGIADRLRGVLETHNSEQAEPLWPWTSTMAQNVDRDLSQEDQPGDEFAYWSN